MGKRCVTNGKISSIAGKELKLKHYYSGYFQFSAFAKMSPCHLQSSTGCRARLMSFSCSSAAEAHCSHTAAAPLKSGRLINRETLKQEPTPTYHRMKRTYQWPKAFWDWRGGRKPELLLSL